MKQDMHAPQINLLAAWLGIVLGFASGLVLGLFFRNEQWLGGYASFRRRLYRLAHISLFGLGVVNLLFYFTAERLPPGAGLSFASLSLIVGAVAMPICCVLVAHFPRSHFLFAVPVLSLLVGGLVTVCSLFHMITL